MKNAAKIEVEMSVYFWDDWIEAALSSTFDLGAAPTFELSVGEDVGLSVGEDVKQKPQLLGHAFL